MLVSLPLLFATFGFLETQWVAPDPFENAERIEFESTPFTYVPSRFAVTRAEKLKIPLEKKVEPRVQLSGFLQKPKSKGPHPAVVLLHTCAGISSHEESWSARLASWGYVVLTVDSLTPRKLNYICDEMPGAPSPWQRALDAYGAKEYLSSLPFVDADRIAVVGMSHGAAAIMELTKESTAKGMSITPFQAAVAYYPLCSKPAPANVPILVLVGGKDTWTPASLCQEYLEKRSPSVAMQLSVFPDSHHLFDHPDINSEDLGHILRSDPIAASTAFRITREFLEENLK